LQQRWGETVIGDLHYRSLFALAIILFLMTFTVNMIAIASFTTGGSNAKRAITNKLGLGLLSLCMLFSAAFLIFFIGRIAFKGGSVISWEFLALLPEIL
jgi:ABC-type phosphate transport system permease subunit